MTGSLTHPRVQLPTVEWSFFSGSLPAVRANMQRWHEWKYEMDARFNHKPWCRHWPSAA
jgi:hypothetical protein